jgi:hypothetical protein
LASRIPVALSRAAQSFRGWGMSLAWEANDLYGGARQPAGVNDPKKQDQYMDLLYGDPATRMTLGFNIVRYYIGAGDDPTHVHMRADAQMEGFQIGPDAAFDWAQDAPQRKMLQEAKKRGANIFEAAAAVQLRVKSSGLCLEDPGRGGTIRQNRCNSSMPNQQFPLTCASPKLQLAEKLN